MYFITNITPQEFRKLLKNLRNLPHWGYNKKQVQSKPIEDYFFLVTRIYKLLKSKNDILICTQRVQ